MQFKVGDKAVYPAHGVGVIKAIETRAVEDVTATFYILKILDNGMTIMVPVQNADANGMRCVIDVEFVDQIYEVLRDRDTPTDKQTWNRRYREYMAKIKTGDPLEVAKVLRDLALMKLEKNLSFGERKMFDQARSLLVQEIAVAKELDEAEVEEEIMGLFGPNGEAKKAKKKKK
ncbi:MAG: CarD family transcriptional regulator [Alphaproteobacteria bacterium]|nr:CarD family transcriptional regulator [Alphaproteobacteria bacterium]